MATWGIYGVRKGRTSKLVGVVKAKSHKAAANIYARKSRKGMPRKIRIYKVRVK